MLSEDKIMLLSPFNSLHCMQSYEREELIQYLSNGETRVEKVKQKIHFAEISIEPIRSMFPSKGTENQLPG